MKYRAGTPFHALICHHLAVVWIEICGLVPCPRKVPSTQVSLFLCHHLAVVWIEISDNTRGERVYSSHHLAVVWIEIVYFHSLDFDDGVTTLRWCGLK